MVFIMAINCTDDKILSYIPYCFSSEYQEEFLLKSSLEFKFFLPSIYATLAP